MTISDKDLFMAILSMDAYNRGYTPGIAVSGTQIGSATFTLGSDQPATGITEGVAAGFYAAAYTTQWGTVISYRGTDNVGLLTAVGGGTDFWSGWVTGAGVVKEGQQADLAMRFYNSVTDGNVLPNISASAILTGHSLGGGLAGRGSLFVEEMSA